MAETIASYLEQKYPPLPRNDADIISFLQTIPTYGTGLSDVFCAMLDRRGTVVHEHKPNADFGALYHPFFKNIDVNHAYIGNGVTAAIVLSHELTHTHQDLMNIFSTLGDPPFGPPAFLDAKLQEAQAEVTAQLVAADIFANALTMVPDTPIDTAYDEFVSYVGLPLPVLKDFLESRGKSLRQHGMRDQDRLMLAADTFSACATTDDMYQHDTKTSAKLPSAAICGSLPLAGLLLSGGGTLALNSAVWLLQSNYVPATIGSLCGLGAAWVMATMGAHTSQEHCDLVQSYVATAPDAPMVSPEISKPLLTRLGDLNWLGLSDNFITRHNMHSQPEQYACLTPKIVPQFAAVQRVGRRFVPVQQVATFCSRLPLPRL